MPPLPILLLGFGVVLGAIIGLRLHAFLALVAAAILVAILAPGESGVKLAAVADGFGKTAGQLGVIVALAAIIGGAMSGSGSSDRIVRWFVDLLGERRGAQALGATAFVLSLPVFFDTIFFLLAPLARSMYRNTGRDYLKYLLAVSAGAVATHALVPPHPGPLAMASALGVDLGTMVLVGVAVALPSAAVGLAFAGWMGRRRAEVRPSASGLPEIAPPPVLPGLALALTPVLLPVLLISSNTVVATLRTVAPSGESVWRVLTPFTSTLGNPNVALLLAAAVALLSYARAQHGPSRADLARLVETALLGAGAIVLIVGAGGAFGAALQVAGVGTLVGGFAGGGAQGAGFALLFLAFAVSVVLRTAQGSATVAMITTAGMIAAMIHGIALPFHPVYIATAIAGGSLVGSWMNDAGFWVFSRAGGVSESETLRTWTPLSAVVGTTAMVVTLLLALVLPLR